VTLPAGRRAWKSPLAAGESCRMRVGSGLAAAAGRCDGADRRLVEGAGLAAAAGHDRGRVLADLACAVADGAEVISDFRVMADQGGLFAPVASVPTCWRMLNEIVAGGQRVTARITAAVNAAWRAAWAGIESRHGAIPGIAIADKVPEDVTCLRLDATVVTCHSTEYSSGTGGCRGPGQGGDGVG